MEITTLLAAVAAFGLPCTILCGTSTRTCLGQPPTCAPSGAQHYRAARA
jgi:hypothetical protein